jgi:putative ABC transport system permease protein
VKLFPLVLANLRRHRLRTVLTILGVALATFLFASLRSVVTTLNQGAEVASASRMVVTHATAIVFPLPMSYKERLAGVKGVEAVTWANWFGGTYGDGKTFFAQYAVDPDTWFAMYPEVGVPPDQFEAFKNERTAALVGKGLMELFGWHVGQNVTIKGSIYPGDWQFTIRGVYTPTVRAFDDRSFIFHYDYLYEHTDHRAIPGWFVLRLSDPSLAPQVAQTVDDMFRNSSDPTKTSTEKAFNQGFITMWGNVRFLMNSIGMAVVFAILMVTANAMMMTARERTGELAVLKTIGFTDQTLFGLVMGEASLITLMGAVLGLGGAKLLYGGGKVTMNGMLPGFDVTPGTLALGFGIAIALALASGIVPAVRAARLSIVQALRHVE